MKLSVRVGAVAAAALASAVVGVVAPAHASARSVVSGVHGIELIAHHTQGTFSGYSTGTYDGGWVAVVDHTPLSPNARVVGGTLTLFTKTTGPAHPITGRFTGGTITMTNPGANCTDQTFKVVGSLAHLGGNRTGVFSVTLKHWRHSILGTCVSYFATTNGTLSVTR